MTEITTNRLPFGRALVTGCAGFIGSHLTETLLSRGVDVVGLDCLSDNYSPTVKERNLLRSREWENFSFLPVDLVAPEARAIVGDCDIVFHLAAEPGVRPSWGQRFEAYVRNNVMATQLLLEDARHSGSRFIYASSSSVYGQAASYPTKEGDLPKPFSPYGVTKLAGEHLCGIYRENFDLGTTSLRFFTVYGPRQRPDMAFSRFFAALHEGQPIEIFGDGTQVRDFTYVGDVVDALLAAATTTDAIGQVINIGGGSQIELNDAINLIFEVTGKQTSVVRHEVQAGDVRITGADSRIAREVLGFQPSVDLREGLRRQDDWLAQGPTR